jgi:hypothetical protein
MKKYNMYLIAAASLAVPIVALAHQGNTQASQTANEAIHHSQPTPTVSGDDKGQVNGTSNKVNENELDDKATPMPSATPTPSATPSATPVPEDSMHDEDNDTNDSDDATETTSGHRGSNSGHNGSDD